MGEKPQKLDCMDYYLTTYKKDYVTWKIQNLKKWIANIKVKNTEYREPIAESFRNYLCLVDPCPEEIEEYVEPFYEKAIATNAGVKDFFDKPLNHAVIKKDKIYQGRSEYQVEYCDLVKEVADKEFRRLNAIRLPNDTNVPLTTNLASHRHPRVINSRVYETKQLPARPANSLDPDHKIRAILKTETGHSEYTHRIGKLGEEIIVKQLHGIIPRL